MTDAYLIDPNDESNVPPDPGASASGPETPVASSDADEQRPVSVLGYNADVRHVSLAILTLLALLYTLHLAQAFFPPIVLAILLNLLLSPIVGLLRSHARIPEPLGAGIVIVVLLGVLGFGAYRLAPAASAWLARAPESLATVQRRIQPLRRPHPADVRRNDRATECRDGGDLRRPRCASCVKPRRRFRSISSSLP
jgi:hypothetical protein